MWSHVDALCGMKNVDPNTETFPIPLKYVDVMRETQDEYKQCLRKIVNDMWTEATGVNLSEEWIGSTRFQILRTRLPEGYKC